LRAEIAIAGGPYTRHSIDENRIIDQAKIAKPLVLPDAPDEFGPGICLLCAGEAGPAFSHLRFFAKKVA
jgi:hypothetical protein